MRELLVDVLKNTYGRWSSLTGGLRYAPDELVVLNLHSTPQDRLDELEDLLRYGTTLFQPMDAAQLDAYYSGALRQGPYLLFTFDDGLQNNFAAAPLLEKYGHRAVFFVVPDFIDAVDGDAYYRKWIRPDIDPRLDHQPEDTRPMSWDTLRLLAESGHIIGSHSMSHRLWHTLGTQELELEIAVSQERIAAQVGKPVDSFCSPNNTLSSVNEEAATLIARHYRYHFTTLPALNGTDKDPLCIFRRNVEIWWGRGRQQLAMGTGDLRRWAPRVQACRELLVAHLPPR